MKTYRTTDAKLVSKWNEKHPLGTEVVQHNPEPQYTKTRSEAWLMRNRAVILIEGKTGGVDCVALRTLTPL